MQKLNVAQAAQHFGISKEAVYNRIRRGSLQSIYEDGMKYVIVDEPTTLKSSIQNATNEALLEFLKDENQILKEKVSALEAKIESLQEQKEQLLIQERDKIEQVYKDKDAQLKSILEIFTTKQITQSTKEFDDSSIHVDVSEKKVEDAEVVVEDDDVDENEEDIEIELKKYLKENGYSSKKRLKIITKVQQLYRYDSRINFRDSKIFIKPDYYDYGDLLDI
jgi:transposase-like protein